MYSCRSTRRRSDHFTSRIISKLSLYLPDLNNIRFRNGGFSNDGAAAFVRNRFHTTYFDGIGVDVNWMLVAEEMNKMTAEGKRKRREKWERENPNRTSRVTTYDVSMDDEVLEPGPGYLDADGDY